MLEFLKEKKRLLIISSLVTLLPILAGLILWDKLPINMAIHFGADGTADGFGSRAFAVFGTSLLILAAHFICIIAVAADPKNREQSVKAVGLVFWIMPALSFVVNFVIYSTSLGYEANTENIVCLILALIFILFGNYMPKTKQNSTLGIKLPWTLYNEENWNVTHRFAGKVWVFGGIALLAVSFLSIEVFIMGLLLLAFAPMVYSYIYYRKQKKEGTFNIGSSPGLPDSRMKSIIGICFTAVILIVTTVLMFTGDIDITFGEESFDINPTFYGGLEVNYSDIASAELRTEDAPGTRTNGFGSPRLSMGRFQNEEFGGYTRYTYTGKNACIVLTDTDGNILVIGGENDDETKALFEKLEEKLSK